MTPERKVFLAITGGCLERAAHIDGAWQVQTVVNASDVRCLAVDPSDAAIVFAGTQGRGVLRSTDGGKTWQPAGLAGQTVKALAISRVEPGTLYAGTMPPMLFVSRNGGASWAELESFRRIPSRWWWRSPAEPSLTAYVQGIALSATDSQVINVGIEAGALVRSEDGGQTWSDHRAGAVRDCHTLVAHAAHGDWVYEAGGTGAGAALSSDRGRTWRQPSAGLDRHYGWACAADGVRPDVWYVSASPMGVWPNLFVPAAHVDGRAHAYIFRSLGGSAWQKLDGGLPSPLMHMAYALLSDPDVSGHLYAGLANGEVWHTADYGDQWQRLPFKFTRIHRALVML